MKSINQFRPPEPGTAATTPIECVYHTMLYGQVVQVTRYSSPKAQERETVPCLPRYSLFNALQAGAARKGAMSEHENHYQSN